MKYLIGCALLATTTSAFAGAGLTEEDYAEMAHIIVEATVTASECQNSIEDDQTITTYYLATLSVSEVLKGEAILGDSESIQLLSAVVEYKGDQPACGKNGRIHPVGEIATFNLTSSDDAETLSDIDQFSTFELEGSSPADNPSCAADAPGPGQNKETGCSVTQSAPLWWLCLPIIAAPIRRLKRS